MSKLLLWAILVKHLSLTGWQMWDPLIAHCCFLTPLHRRRMTKLGLSISKPSEWMQISWSSFLKYPIGLQSEFSIIFLAEFWLDQTPSMRSSFQFNIEETLSRYSHYSKKYSIWFTWRSTDVCNRWCNGN